MTKAPFRLRVPMRIPRGPDNRCMGSAVFQPRGDGFDVRDEDVPRPPKS